VGYDDELGALEGDRVGDLYAAVEYGLHHEFGT
jgi:hypothetical protein